MKGWIAAVLVLLCAATAQAKAWDEGGSLHGVSVSAWSMATDENILPAWPTTSKAAPTSVRCRRRN